MEGMFFNRVPHPFNPQLMVNQLPLTVLNIFIIRILFYMIMVRVKYLSMANSQSAQSDKRLISEASSTSYYPIYSFKGLLIYLKTKSLHTFVTQNIIQCFYKMLSSAMWHLMELIKFLIGKIPWILFCQS